MGNQKKNSKNFRNTLRRTLGDCGFRRLDENALLRRGAKKMTVDIFQKGTSKIFVVARFQERKGTAEQKVPYLVLRLDEMLSQMRVRRGFLVLGGGGWSLIKYFQKELLRRLKCKNKISILKDTDVSRVIRRAA